MAVTLETIHEEIQQLKNELHRVRCMLEDEGELTREARRELADARKQMDHGEYVSHEEIMARYG